MLGRADDSAFIPTSLPSDHARTYSNPYEESFAQNTGAEGVQEDMNMPETSIERDNKLLSFNLPTYNFELLNWSLQRTSLSLTAQLHGMFFMAESPSTADISAPSNELTCYRRNLFQITGSITLPRTLRYIVTDQGNRIPIVAQELTISATESAEGHPVKLISVPWKTPAVNASSTPEEKTEKEPTSIPLDTMSNQDMDADYATFPIAWKRLQFRIATANNGRRKELQQHFVVRLKVVATLSTGTKVPICEAKSGAIIVRGRSPRNFQQRKDFPVGTAGNSARKNHPTLARGTNSDSSTAQQTGMKNELSPDLSLNCFNFDKQELQTPTSFSDGNKKSSSTPPHAPVKLSLTDDGPSSNTPPRSHKAARTTNSNSASKPPVFKQPSFSSSAVRANLNHGLDSADLLYEYFPLGLDDWQPPVDAVYRPHVVHHVAAGTGSVIGKPGPGGRSKRYFSEDQS